jgi:5-methylcytosine-specific restriction endonuclease McrA
VVHSPRKAEIKVRLLEKYGNGTECPCWICGDALTIDTMTVDRAKPGAVGGTYAFDNCRPACDGCNKERGDTSLARNHPGAFEKLLEFYGMEEQGGR